MPTDAQRIPAPVHHRIIHRDYHRGVIVEGVVTLNADGTFTEVEPLLPRPMSFEELGRQLLEPTTPPPTCSD